MRYESGAGVIFGGAYFRNLRYFFLFWEVKLMKESGKTNTIVYYIVSCFSTTFIEDITRWREDMNLFSSGKTIFYEQAQRVSKILFLPRENKIHIFKPPCNVLFII